MPFLFVQLYYSIEIEFKRYVEQYLATLSSLENLSVSLNF